jgi:hypothetical protein
MGSNFWIFAVAWMPDLDACEASARHGVIKRFVHAILRMEANVVGEAFGGGSACLNAPARVLHNRHVKFRWLGAGWQGREVVVLITVCSLWSLWRVCYDCSIPMVLVG